MIKENQCIQVKRELFPKDCKDRDAIKHRLV